MSLKPLEESWIQAELAPRFSRTLARNEIYLANHSLGRPLDAMADDVRGALDLWYSGMDEAWDAWFQEFIRFEQAIKTLIAWPQEGAVVPKSNVGQALRAVLNSMSAHPMRVLATRGEFDSVDFILKAYQARGLVQVHWIEPTLNPVGIPVYRAEDYLDVLSEVKPDLVLISVALFATGQVMPRLSDLVMASQAVGARVFLDTYHAAGIVPFDHAGADYAAGGCYKYLRGGPGACWLAIHPKRLSDKTLDTGWFAKPAPFSYARSEEDDRAEGGMGWWESTPPVLPVFQARSGLAFTLEVGVERIREYSLRQLDSLRSLLQPFGGFTPSDPGGWGGYALQPVDQPMLVARRLKEQGVNVDARGNCVRWGPDLLNTEREFEQAMGALSRVMSEVGVV